MNIFLVNRSPRVCAQALDDLRLNKMILETGQLLCTAYRRLYMQDGEAEFPGIYKDTHVNHPCAVWTRSRIKHYIWLLVYFKALNSERLYRGFAPHLTFKKLYEHLYKPVKEYSLDEAMFYENDASLFDDIEFTFNCSNVTDSLGIAVFRDYRVCLVNKWRKDIRQPKWTNREPPVWYTK